MCLIWKTVAVLSLIFTVEANWIIERIPKKTYYNYRALALSKARIDTNLMRLSKELRAAKDNWVSSTSDQASGETPTQADSSSDTTACTPITSFPANSGIPCGLSRDDTPMFVFFTFDDAVTSWNIGFYRRLFTEDKTNPNGCPARATFFNSHDNTQYDLLKSLYDAGHEIASHSVSHRGPSTWWSVNATQQDWRDEIVGQRDNIHHQTTGRMSGDPIPARDIRGMRAPFLALGGDKQFRMLEKNGFVYDSSIANNNERPSWPFTLDNPETINGPICRSPHCPSERHSIWEAVMNVYYLDREGTSIPCSMVDGCRPDGGSQGAFDFIMNNFRRHYDNEDKVPFGINMHAAWFAFDGYFDGMLDFIDHILTYDDVYIVPVYNVISWIKEPIGLKKMATSDFACTK